MRKIFKNPVVFTVLFAVATAVVGPSVQADQAARVFSTPEAALTALITAVRSTNHTAFGFIFGEAVEQLVNPDEVQGAAELAAFSAELSATNRLVRETPSRIVLEVGTNGWPFPIPLVKTDQGWQFDTRAGLEELLNRRIGRNELNTLRVMRAYAQAQREYAARDRDGDQVLEYAQRLVSSPGKTDGLFWSPEVTGEISPLGPLIANAQGEGYFRKDRAGGRQPFHGYFFKVLTRQGKHAPGGKYDYLINGNMIGGFAMVAWPAEYGESGIMTFIINQQGRVFQKDLGENTGKIASGMSSYDPDKTWHLSTD